MEQKHQVISECRKNIDLYQKNTKKEQKDTVSLLYEAFYNAVIKNKDALYQKINCTRNVKELADYMRNGSFAEDAGDDFAAQMFAATINS